jgi:hypothetical protein
MTIEMVAPYIPSPQPNPLEQALTAALTDPAQQDAFVFALLTAEIYVVPTEGLPPEGKVFGVDVPFRLQGVVLKDGIEATAVFTAPERAKAVFGEDKVMGMAGQHALEIMGERWLILNPGSPPGLVLSPDQSKAILSAIGDAAPSAPIPPHIEIGLPERTPTALIDRLQRVLPKPQIAGAWLSRVTDRNTGAKSWRLDVRADISLATVRADVDRAIAGVDFFGEPMELVYARANGPDGYGIKIV